jgi:hypothetical protein
MTTVSSAGRLSPYSQLEQLCSSLGSLIGSVREPDKAFLNLVHVNVTDQDGIITPSRVYSEDVNTGDMYKNEKWDVIAAKCGLVAFGTPLYTLGKMAWHVFDTSMMIIGIALETLVEVGRQFACKRFQKGLVEMREGLSEIAGTLGAGLFEVVSAPIFGLGVEVAALYGIFKPYHGRKFVAMIEKAWHKGASYRDDVRKFVMMIEKSLPKGASCKDFIKKFSDFANKPSETFRTRPLYLAYCFQVRGNTRDTCVQVLVQAGY